MSATDEWWKSLTVVEKERIAGKVNGAAQSQYPECTRVWLALDEAKKQWIMSHCIKSHGIVTPDWQEGKVFSF